jgi:hypothetical protein
MPQVNVGIDLLNTPSEFEPLPDAWYKAQVTGCEVKTSDKPLEEGKTRYPYIEWNLKIVDGPRESNVFYITTLMPPKKGYPSSVKGMLVATKTPYIGDKFNTEDALGRFLMVHLVLNTYEGKVNNKVGAVKECKD